MMRGLNILFQSYWGAADNLTAATVYPHVRILAELPFVASVWVCTIERDGPPSPSAFPRIPKAHHIAFRSRDVGVNLATKALDVATFSARLVSLVRRHAIDAMVCRSSLAGILGYAAHVATGVPYLVESFEPHAEYAVEAGAWRRRGAKASFLRLVEQRQLRTATGIMPVTHGYADQLRADGVAPSKLRVVPCGVPLEAFAYSDTVRRSMRERLGLGTSLVGIYVGKFGGLYYEQESFEVFRDCFDLLPEFRLIVLSPHADQGIRARMEALGIDLRRVVLASVPHDEVPAYLSAADFALALYAPSPSKRALSPIKVGEYWASGLPVLMTEGVGDESSFMEQEHGGALLSATRDNLRQGLDRILAITRDPEHRRRIEQLARIHRSFGAAHDAYVAFLEPLTQGGARC